MAEQLEGRPTSLLHLPEGRTVRVVRLDRVETTATGHLVALGVLPGVELTLVQRYPAFVVRIGHAEFALDGELAGRIQVMTAPAPAPFMKNSHSRASSPSRVFP